jgi:RNA polymerase sigma-70 factor, ECF subfamily
MSARAPQDDAILKAPAGSDRTISTAAESRPRAPSRSLPCRPVSDSRRTPRLHLLDPNRLPDYIGRLYRAAWALCGSRHDAEGLVQETFATVLKRPRLLRNDNEIGYLLRALRNTYANRYRTAARRPATRQLFENDAPSVDDSRVNARDIMQAIASAPAPYRDAVIAVDLIGLSYREAARSVRTREATINPCTAASSPQPAAATSARTASKDRAAAPQPPPSGNPITIMSPTR